MKKIIISVVLITTIGLVGPKIIGGGVNQKIDDFVATVNQTPGYQVTVVTQESSWTSTVATINVGLDPALLGDMASNPMARELLDDLSVNFYVTAQHGPFLTLNGPALGLLAVKADAEKTLLREQLIYSEDKPLYSLAINLGLLGGASFSDKLQAFKLREAETVSISSWNGKGSMSSNHFDYQGEMDGFTAELGPEKLALTSVALNINTEDSLLATLTSPFYDSAGDFTIGSILFDDSAGGKVALKNINISGASEVSKDGQLMDIDIKYGVEEVSIPNFNASDLLLKTQLVNLEKGFMTVLQNASNNLIEMEQLAELFDASILAQLQASPEFNITELSGKVGDGDFAGNMLIKLTGVNQMPAYLADPGFWLSKLVVNSRLEIEKATAIWVAEKILTNQLQSNNAGQMDQAEIESLAREQAEITVNMLTAQGMVTVNAKNNLELTFSVKDGLVVLNGNPIPLPF